MNKFGHLLLLLFGIMTGCINKQPQLKNNILKIDLDADYPSKDLAIQELMDVEYIALETSGDVVCEGQILDMGNNYILVGNNKFDG